MSLTFLVEDLLMGTTQHIVAVCVSVLLVIALFFSRKFFMKYKIADIIMRVFLACILIIPEFKLRFSTTGSSTIVLNNLPLPLCGMLLWIAAIGCLANSERIMKTFYPVFLTASTMALIVCDVPGTHFPQFRAFQYFFCHTGFLLATCYFVFTRKINHYDFKDFGKSCLAVGYIAAVMAVGQAINPGMFRDYLYLFGNGMELLKPIKDALGQIGYTLVYMLVIASAMALYTTITYFLTRKRPDYVEPHPYKKNKFLDFISYKIPTKGRQAIMSVTIIALMFFMAWQGVIVTDPAHNNLRDPSLVALGWVICVLWFLVIAVSALNEYAHYYIVQQKIMKEDNIPTLEEKELANAEIILDK